MNSDHPRGGQVNICWKALKIIGWLMLQYSQTTIKSFSLREMFKIFGKLGATKGRNFFPGSRRPLEPILSGCWDRSDFLVILHCTRHLAFSLIGRKFFLPFWILSKEGLERLPWFAMIKNGEPVEMVKHETIKNNHLRAFSDKNERDRRKLHFLESQIEKESFL